MCTPLEPPRRGGSNGGPTIYVWNRNMKNIIFFLSENSVFGGEIFNIFEYACFHNAQGFCIVCHYHRSYICEIFMSPPFLPIV